MTTALTKVSGIGPSTAKVLTENGFESAQQLADTTILQLSKVPGFSTARASRTIKAANALLSVSADASAISSTNANAAQVTMQQPRAVKKAVPRTTDSTPVPVTDTKADTDTNESAVELVTGKDQKKAAKKAKKAAKKAKKAAMKAKKAAMKAKKAAKKAAKKVAKKAVKVKKKAAKAKKKAKKKAQSRKNKK